MGQALDDLFDALEDVDDATREEASKALAELADPASLDALVERVRGRVLGCPSPCWPWRCQDRRDESGRSAHCTLQRFHHGRAE